MIEHRGPAALVQREQAAALVESLADERLRAFMKYGLTTVIARRSMTPGIHPIADFDLLFYAEALRAMAADRRTLLCILEGDLAAISWWLDGED